MSNKVYEIVTQAIIEKLENIDPKDYERPWFNIGLSPINAISKKAYRGANHILLSNMPYKSNFYASYKQWTEKKCQVKKGEKSHMVVFWLWNEDEDTGEKWPTIRYYRVFNSEQVEGDFARILEDDLEVKLLSHDPIQEAQEIVEGYLYAELLKTKEGDSAYYSHSPYTGSEYISMPKLGQFKDPESYYSVFFHEMTHSTGNTKRLKREMSGKFGSKEYAKEELVAELGAAMLCGAIGLSQKPREDHAQYIASWLKCLKNDNRFIFSAASQAQKAADFIQERAADAQAGLVKAA